MSQKKAKKLRRIETVTLMETTDIEHVKGIRQILKENWKFLLFLSLGIFVLYFNSLHGDFVSDDYATILNNSELTTSKYALNGFSSTYFINSLIANVFGVTPLAYHFFSLLLYISVCWLAFLFLYSLFDKRISIVALLIFAVLPVHVEAVSWISGKGYLFIAFYLLVSMIFFIKYVETNKNWYLLGVIIPFILSFLNDKPRPFLLFLIIPIYLILKNISIKKIKVFRYWPIMIIVLLALACLIWPNIVSRINSVNSGYNGYGGIFYDPFFQYPTSIAKYLQLVFIPVDLTLYHTMYVLPTWLNWLITLSYLIAVIYFYFKDKKIFFALAFIFAATAPSMAPVKVSWLVAERYVFLGSLGFCLFLAIIFEKIYKKNVYIAIILLAFLMSFYSIRTFLRNVDWQTNHNLWVNTCQVSPNSHNAWNNIGDDYDKLAQLETTDEEKIKQYLFSIRGFTQSVTVKSNYADAYHNRANIFYKIGRYDLARDSYETALSYGPNLYQSYYSLLQIDLTEKNFNSAINHLNKLNTIRPNDPQVYYAAAVVYVNMGQTEQAVSILEQLIKVNPGWTQAIDLLTQLKTNQTTVKK
ncbi:MAG: tetratricopeptide repeat protein [Candidatus Shapirobacteria bacterium]